MSSKLEPNPSSPTGKLLNRNRTRRFRSGSGLVAATTTRARSRFRARARRETTVPAIGFLHLQHLSPTSLPLHLSARRRWNDRITLLPPPPPPSTALHLKPLSLSIENRTMEKPFSEPFAEETHLKPKRRLPRRRKKSGESMPKKIVIVEKLGLSFHSLQSEKPSSEIKPANIVKEGEVVKHVEPGMELNCLIKKKKKKKKKKEKGKDLIAITGVQGSCLEKKTEFVPDNINGREINDDTSKDAAYALLMISNSQASNKACLESSMKTATSEMKAPRKNGSTSINGAGSCLDINAEANSDKNSVKKVIDLTSKVTCQKRGGTSLEAAVESTGSRKKKKSGNKKTNTSPFKTAGEDSLGENAEVTLDEINKKKIKVKPLRTDLQATGGVTDSKKKKMHKIMSEKKGLSPTNNVEGSADKNEEATSYIIHENEIRGVGSGMDKQSIDPIKKKKQSMESFSLRHAANSTDSEKKKSASKAKDSSAVIIVGGSSSAQVHLDKIIEHKIGDIPSNIAPEMKDGKFTVLATERVESAESCDPECTHAAGVSTPGIGDDVEIKCLPVDPSGKKPMTSNASLVNEFNNRHLKQYRRMRQQMCNSNHGLVDNSQPQEQANRGGASKEKHIEPEILSRINEEKYKHPRWHQKAKEYLQEHENISGSPNDEFKTNSVINASLHVKLDPMESDSQNPKLKYKYLKRVPRHKHKDTGPICLNNLVDNLEATESLKILSCRSEEESHEFVERVNINTAVVSEELETGSHVSPATVRNAAISEELPRKIDLPPNAIKEKASDKTLLVVGNPTSQQCLHEESRPKPKEKNVGETSVNDGHKRSQAKDTVKHSPVIETAARGSLLDDSNSSNIFLETNHTVLDKVSEQDNWLKVEKPLVRLRKKLLVLDLNGLLIDILYVSNVTHRTYKRINGKSAFKRPFCKEFLDFCFKAFDVGLWSSRMRNNMDAAVDYVMGDMKHRLLFSWDQSKCTKTGYKTIENSHKPLVLKELMKLWNKEEQNLPWETGTYSPSNTLLIDDSPYKALCNPPYTAIFPHPFNFENDRDNSLGPGGDIRTYLEGLTDADDVQEYVKRHPFGQKSIAEDHPSWTFYLRVKDRVKILGNAATNQ